MRTTFQYPLPSTTAGLVAALVLAGCATPPPQADGFAQLPLGTMLSYWRASTGSFGNGEGQVDWRLEATTWQGQPVDAAVSPQAGTTLYTLGSRAIVAQLNTAGKPTQVFAPPLGYAWPLAVGKRWTSNHTLTLPANNRSLDISVTWEVQAHERITVKAGSFDTWRVLSTDSLGEVQRVWASPASGIAVVKRELMRPASHPQGAGTLNGEMVAFQRGG